MCTTRNWTCGSHMLKSRDMSEQQLFRQMVLQMHCTIYAMITCCLPNIEGCFCCIEDVTHNKSIIHHQICIFEENPNLVVTSWYLSQLGCKMRNPCGNPVVGNLTFSNLDGSTCSWTHFLRGSWICKGKCLFWPVWPYMAIPSNTQVLYLVWNSFSMWIQWWCPFCNESDHIWQNR